MYQNNHFQNKPIIKLLFVICFSFLNCPAFSENISTNLSISNSETEDMAVSQQQGTQAQQENVLHSVWKISKPYPRNKGTAFAIGPNNPNNKMITNFHVISRVLGSGGSLEDIVLTQSGSSSQLKIQRVLKVSALYDLVLFETKETVSNYLELTDDFLGPKEELSIVGYPKGVLTTIQKTGNIFQTGSFSYFPVNTINLFGASGSPVLNTQGKVVGVAYGRRVNLLRFTKVINIQKFLSGQESTLCSPFPSPVKCFEQEMMNLMQMSEEGSAFAQYRLAYIYMEWGFYELVFESMLIKKSAEQGFAISQYLMAYMYEEGIGREINLELAFQWYKKAAEQDLAISQHVLANMYREGIGREINLELAFQWYKKAAEQDLAISQHVLADMYREGIAREINLELAFQWYKKAAEQGLDVAQHALADMYREGIGREINLELAFQWYKKAAEQDLDVAQHALADMYREGIGREINLELAFQWYKKAAEQGLDVAQHALADMYREGIGREINLELAFQWYKKAAEQGYAPAQDMVKLLE